MFHHITTAVIDPTAIPAAAFVVFRQWVIGRTLFLIARLVFHALQDMRRRQKAPTVIFAPHKTQHPLRSANWFWKRDVRRPGTNTISERPQIGSLLMRFRSPKSTHVDSETLSTFITLFYIGAVTLLIDASGLS